MKKKFLTLLLIVPLLLFTGCSHDSDSNKSDSSKKISEEKTTEVQKSEKSEKEKELEKKTGIDFSNIYPNNEIKEYALTFIQEKAKDFTLTNMDGKEVSLSDFKGKKVILEFGRSTCPACQQMQSVVDSFKKEHKDIPVIQIFGTDNKKGVQSFLNTTKSQKHEYLLTGEKDNTIFDNYKIKYVPTFLFVDENGVVQMVHVGTTDLKTMENYLKLAYHTQK